MRRFLLAIAALCLALPGLGVAKPVNNFGNVDMTERSLSSLAFGFACNDNNQCVDANGVVCQEPGRCLDDTIAGRPCFCPPLVPKSLGAAAVPTQNGWYCNQDLSCRYLNINGPATQNAAGIPTQCWIPFCSTANAVNQPCSCPRPSTLDRIKEPAFPPPKLDGWYCNANSTCKYESVNGGPATQNAAGIPAECQIDSCSSAESLGQQCFCPRPQASKILARSTPPETDFWMCTTDKECVYHHPSTHTGILPKLSCHTPRCAIPEFAGTRCSCSTHVSNTTTTASPAPKPTGTAIITQPILPGYFCRNTLCIAPNNVTTGPKMCIDRRCLVLSLNETACGCSADSEYHPYNASSSVVSAHPASTAAPSHAPFGNHTTTGLPHHNATATGAPHHNSTATGTPHHNATATGHPGHPTTPPHGTTTMTQVHPTATGYGSILPPPHFNQSRSIGPNPAPTLTGPSTSSTDAAATGRGGCGELLPCPHLPHIPSASHSVSNTTFTGTTSTGASHHGPTPAGPIIPPYNQDMKRHEFEDENAEEFEDFD